MISRKKSVALVLAISLIISLAVPFQFAIAEEGTFTVSFMPSVYGSPVPASRTVSAGETVGEVNISNPEGYVLDKVYSSVGVDSYAFGYSSYNSTPFTLALREDGTVWYKDINTEDFVICRNIDEAVLTDIVQISAGYDCALALDSNGIALNFDVYGSDYKFHPIILPVNAPPCSYIFATDDSSDSPAYFFICENDVYAWSEYDNTDGRFGADYTGGDCSSIYTSSGSKPVKVISHNGRTGILLEDGTLLLSGNNINGNLGVNSNDDYVNSFVEASLPTNVKVKDFCIESLVYALCEDNAVYASGNTDFTKISSSLPSSAKIEKIISAGTDVDGKDQVAVLLLDGSIYTYSDGNSSFEKLEGDPFAFDICGTSSDNNEKLVFHSSSGWYGIGCNDEGIFDNDSTELVSTLTSVKTPLQNVAYNEQPIYNDVTFNVKWKLKNSEYDVTFKVQGEAGYITKKTVNGKIASFPTEDELLTKVMWYGGRTLLGWTNESNVAVTSDTVITENTTVYANFRDKSISRPYAQLKEGASQNAQTNDIRFIAAIPSTNFKSAGLDITFTKFGEETSKSNTHETTTIYQTIVADGKSVTAESLGGFALISLTITSVPKNQYGGTFVVTPFVKKANGEKVSGTAKTYIISDMFKSN